MAAFNSISVNSVFSCFLLRSRNQLLFKSASVIPQYRALTLSPLGKSLLETIYHLQFLPINPVFCLVNITKIY